jgi:hypothetical protein
VSTSRPAELADLIVSNMPSFSDALEKGVIGAIGQHAICVRHFRCADLVPTQRNQPSWRCVVSCRRSLR